MWCNTEGKVPKGGTSPLSAHGTHFVRHKIEALNSMVDRYGALTEDRTVKSSDKQKLKATIKYGRMQRYCLDVQFLPRF